MIFTDKTFDREIEKLFGRPPGFRPRRHGIFVSEKAEYNAERCGCRESAERKKKRRVSGEKTLCYAFWTIRKDEITILDFIKYAVRYFITAQQYYEWR